MTGEQRSRILRRYMQRWAAAPADSFEECICKRIILALGYGAGVRKVNRMSRQFRADWKASDEQPQGPSGLAPFDADWHTAAAAVRSAHGLN